MRIKQHFDTWSLIVLAITLVLFIAALFFTGFTHALLLEAGVFLVSVKLMLMAYKNSVADAAMQRKLNDIHASVRQLGQARAVSGAAAANLPDASETGGAFDAQAREDRH